MSRLRSSLSALPPTSLVGALRVGSLLSVLLCLVPYYCRGAVVSVNLSSSLLFPISPSVYGANFASSTMLQWGVGVNRNGGNAQSVWNWQLDATNSGADWYFLSEPYSHSYPSGSSNDLQMDATFTARSTYITQVSAIGWGDAHSSEGVELLRRRGMAHSRATSASGMGISRTALPMRAMVYSARPALSCPTTAPGIRRMVHRTRWPSLPI